MFPGSGIVRRSRLAVSKSEQSARKKGDCIASVNYCHGGIPAECHPSVQAITDYWRSIHPGANTLPGRQHFDPIDVPALLANIRLVDVVGTPPRFQVRLTGTRLTQFHGASDTGRWLDEIYPDFRETATWQNYMRVVESRLPNWRRGHCELRGATDYLQYERVQLPFARDGATVDMILILGVFGREGGALF